MAESAGIMLITHRERAGRNWEPWRGPGVSQTHPVPELWASLPGAADAAEAGRRNSALF